MRTSSPRLPDSGNGGGLRLESTKLAPRKPRVTARVPLKRRRRFSR
jgi:hypothetical protein